MVLLPAYAFRRAVGHDFAGGVSGPNQRGPVVEDAQIENFAFFDQSDGLEYTLFGYLVQGAYLVIGTPHPAPAFALLPLLRFGRGRISQQTEQNES